MKVTKTTATIDVVKASNGLANVIVGQMTADLENDGYDGDYAYDLVTSTNWASIIYRYIVAHDEGGQRE